MGLARDARRHLLVEQVRVVGNRRATGEVLQLTGCEAVFRDLSWSRLPFASRLRSLEFYARRFAQDCERIRNISPDDILLVPSAQHNQVRGLELFLSSLAPASRPRVMLNFHVDNMTSIPSLRQPLKGSFARLQEMCGNKIAITTPVRELTRQLRAICSDVTAWTYPLPQNYSLCIADPLQQVRTSRPVIAVLGRPLKRKGTTDIARLLAHLSIGRPQCKFIVQSTFGAKGFLRQLLSPQVTLKLGGVSPREYGLILQQSDVVLLPYDREAYRQRTSGIFADCAAYGKVAVVPSDTWMAEQIEQGRAAGVVYKGTAELDIHRAACAALDDLAALKKTAESSRHYWLQQQSTKAYVERMLGDFYPISKIPTFRLSRMDAENDPEYTIEIGERTPA